MKKINGPTKTTLGVLLVLGIVLLSGCGGRSGGGLSGASTGTAVGFIFVPVAARGASAAPAGYMPLAGATVTCAGIDTLTDSAGMYTLTNLPAGEQTLTATKTGYGTVTKTITITAGQTLAVNEEDELDEDFIPTLTPATSGVLAVTSSPTGASIIIGGATASITTDANLALPAGSYAVSVSLTGYEAVTATSTTVTQGAATKTVSFTLTPNTTAIAVTPTSASVEVENEQQFAAACTYFGSTTSGTCTTAPTWKSSNTSVATISPTGLLAAVSPGTTTVTASRTQSGKTSNSVTVTVACPSGKAWISGSCQTVTLATITTTCASSVAEGSEITCTAACEDNTGNVMTCPTLVWTSSNESYATVVSTSGVVTGEAAGSVTITATSGSVSDASAAITVTPGDWCTTVTATVNVSGSTANIMGFDGVISYGTASILETSAVAAISTISDNFNCTLGTNKVNFNCYTTSAANALAAGYSGGLVTLTFTVSDNSTTSTVTLSSFQTSNSTGDTETGYTATSVTYDSNETGSCGMGTITASK